MHVTVLADCGNKRVKYILPPRAIITSAPLHQPSPEATKSYKTLTEANKYFTNASHITLHIGVLTI